MFCIKCGQEVVDGSTFCLKCGEKIIPYKENLDKNSKDTSIRKRQKFLSILSLIFCTLGIILFVYLVIANIGLWHPLNLLSSLFAIVVNIISIIVLYHWKKNKFALIIGIGSIILLFSNYIRYSMYIQSLERMLH